MACTCEDALAALSRHLGLPLEFHDDACAFLVGGQHFSVRRDGEPERLVVSALVADDLPPAPSRALVSDLLDLGFGILQSGLPAVARDPETGFIAAFAVFPLATLTAPDFLDAFDKFTVFATGLADRFAAEHAGAAPAAAAEPPPDDDALSADFLKV